MCQNMPKYAKTPSLDEGMERKGGKGRCRIMPRVGRIGSLDNAQKGGSEVA